MRIARINLVPLVLIAGCRCGADPDEHSCDPAVGIELLASGAAEIGAFDDCPGMVLDGLRVVGDGDLSVELEPAGDGAIRPVVRSASGGTLRAVVLSGELRRVGPAPERIWKQGYESWSASGVFDLADREVVRAPDGYPVFAGDDGVTQVIEETPWSSWWGGLVGAPGGEVAMLGALTAETSKFAVSYETDGAVTAVWGGPDQRIELPAGGSVELDAVWGAWDDDPNALMDRWGHRGGMERLPSPTRTRSPRRRRRSSPAGRAGTSTTPTSPRTTSGRALPRPPRSGRTGPTSR